MKNRGGTVKTGLKCLWVRLLVVVLEGSKWSLGSTSTETFFTGWTLQTFQGRLHTRSLKRRKFILHEKMLAIVIISFSCMSSVICIFCTYKNRLTENVYRKPLVGNIKKGKRYWRYILESANCEALYNSVFSVLQLHIPQ